MPEMIPAVALPGSPTTGDHASSATERSRFAARSDRTRSSVASSSREPLTWITPGVASTTKVANAAPRRIASVAVAGIVTMTVSGWEI
eukprot:3733881-Prymnesium_polylepis.1